MKARVNYYKKMLFSVKEDIKEDLITYFNEVKHAEPSSDIQIVNLNSEEDIQKVYSGTGFYVILAKQQFSDNSSTFAYQERKALYRGHCYSVKKRIMSHLANNRYNESNSLYKVCLKVNPGENGVNIDQEPYNSWGWTVIVHKMKGSSKVMREQAELAFDSVFGKPCKSREK